MCWSCNKGCRRDSWVVLSLESTEVQCGGDANNSLVFMNLVFRQFYTSFKVISFIMQQSVYRHVLSCLRCGQGRGCKLEGRSPLTREPLALAHGRCQKD